MSERTKERTAEWTTERPAGRKNLFDEDITSIYQLALPSPRQPAYTMQVMEIEGEEEQYMLGALHQQYVAIEGRSAIAQLVDTRAAELGSHAAFEMGRTVESVVRVEAATQAGRLGKRFQEFNNRLVDQTASHMLQTNAIAVRSMHEDMRRDIYKPPAPPAPLPRRKWKGLFREVGEFLFGEP